MGQFHPWGNSTQFDTIFFQNHKRPSKRQDTKKNIYIQIKIIVLIPF